MGVCVKVCVCLFVSLCVCAFLYFLRLFTPKKNCAMTQHACQDSTRRPTDWPFGSSCRDFSWHIRTFAMTYSYVCHDHLAVTLLCKSHDAFIRVLWLIRVCAMTLYIGPAIDHFAAVGDAFASSFVCVPWLVRMCAMTQHAGRANDHSAVVGEVFALSFVCAPWLIRTCAMTGLYMWHDSQHTGPAIDHWRGVCSLVHVCRDSFIRVPWLVCTCDMTRNTQGQQSTIQQLLERCLLRSFAWLLRTSPSTGMWGNTCMCVYVWDCICVRKMEVVTCMTIGCRGASYGFCAHYLNIYAHVDILPIYICAYVTYIYTLRIYVYAHVHMYIHIYMCTNTHIYIYIYTHIYIHIYVYIHIYIYIDVCVYI